MSASHNDNSQPGLTIQWLGQSGFYIRGANCSFVIDPYLSDTLEQLTRDDPQTRHVRIYPPSVGVEDLGPVDIIFCTHEHLDHYDRPTVARLWQRNPQAVIVAPCTMKEQLLRDGFPQQVLRLADGKNPFTVKGVRVQGIPGKHNRFDSKDALAYPWLGYFLTVDGYRLYHAGDTLLYPELPAILAACNLDIAFLPINGYDARRIEKGFMSNMTCEEAADLAWQAGVRMVIPCHYDMFYINTEQVGNFINYINRAHREQPYWVPVPGKTFLYPETKGM